MRSLTSSARFFLVQKLKISNKEASELIVSRKLLINKKPAKVNQPIETTDLVELEGRVLQKPKVYHYIAYYKPRGVETTLNTKIPDNLKSTLNFSDHIYPVGRLDKESEGLLLLTNDGRIYNKILHSEEKQEKEYVVSVNKNLTHGDLKKLASGIKIIGKYTAPAQVTQLSINSFNIVLTEGKNRQIRRMCYKLGLIVTSLIRVRVISVCLGNLKPGEYKPLSKDEKANLFSHIGIP